MKKKILVTGMIFVIIALFFGASVVSAIDTVNIGPSIGPATSLDSSVDDQVESIDQEYADMMLASPWNIDVNKMTMGEVKQLIYKEIAKYVLSMDTTLILKVGRVFETLEEIGVTSGMTIAQAKSIIDKNKEKLELASGDYKVNLLCYIKSTCRYRDGQTHKWGPLPPEPFFSLDIEIVHPGDYIKITGLLIKQYYDRPDGSIFDGDVWLFRGTAKPQQLADYWPFYIDPWWRPSLIAITNVP